MDRPQRRVAGLDVRKDTVFLCIMDNSKAKIFERVYSTYTPSLAEMRRDMVTFGVTEAAMESTATYWIPVWNALCGSMALKLANPYFIKLKIISILRWRKSRHPTIRMHLLHIIHHTSICNTSTGNSF